MNQNELLGQRLKEIFPELAERLSNVARIDDLSLLPDIMDYICIQNDTDMFTVRYDKEEWKRIRLIGTAVILTLYDPDVLDFKTQIKKKGLKDYMAELFEVSRSSVTMLIAEVRDILVINLFFNRQVKELATGFEKRLKHKK
ncbi:MAG: hypothetical protein ACOYXB_00600 [Bacteroidota bacterium]